MLRAKEGCSVHALFHKTSCTFTTNSNGEPILMISFVESISHYSVFSLR